MTCRSSAFGSTLALALALAFVLYAVIPAKAGIALALALKAIIPAKAGIAIALALAPAPKSTAEAKTRAIPAFAGMTS